MSRGPDRATLLVTIDVGGAIGTAADSVSWLAESLEQHTLPATWAVLRDDWHVAVPMIGEHVRICGGGPCGTATGGCGPRCTHSGCTEGVAAGHHEFAYSVGSLHAEAARGAFAAELAAQARAAEQACCRPEALLVRGGRVPAHLDLLARAGIRAVGLWQEPGQRSHAMWRLIAAWWGDASEAAPPARLLRHGVWELPAGLAAPGIGWRSAAGAIESCVRRGTLLHLVVHASACGSARARAEVAQLLACLALRREQGALAADTLSSHVTRLMASRSTQPSRSILRPRAA